MTAPTPVIEEVDLDQDLICTSSENEQRCGRPATWRLIFRCTAVGEPLPVLCCDRHRRTWQGCKRTWCTAHGHAPTVLESVGRL